MLKIFVRASLGLWLGAFTWGQTSADQSPPSGQQPAQEEKPGIAREIGEGMGSIGDGIARGAGAVAKGTAKGASELVTWHPIEAVGSASKTAAVGTKDATVGAAKGTGRFAVSIGRTVRDLF